MMEGAAILARLNVSRRIASPSPTNMLNSCAHDSGSIVAREAVAAARARVVLLQPGQQAGIRQMNQGGQGPMVTHARVRQIKGRGFETQRQLEG